MSLINIASLKQFGRRINCSFHLFSIVLILFSLPISCYFEDTETDSGSFTYTKASVTLANNTSYTITVFYISPDTSTVWSSNDEYLKGTVLASGGTKTVKNITAGTYDLRVDTASQKAELYGQILNQGKYYTWTVTNVSLVAK